MQKFSDFAEEKPFVGSKIKITEVIDKPIIVEDFRITKSKWSGECLTLQIKYQNESRIIFTGSLPLCNQCRKFGENMPFETTIRKVNKYYSFT